MNADVYWIFELNIKPGRDNDFRKLMREMIGHTHVNEQDTIGYQWSLSEDGKTCHIFEQYTDSDAVMAHLANFGAKYAKRFMEVLSPVKFVVYGAPSQEVREALVALNPTYMSNLAGFIR
jgi:quinol monooxygenase YgiN